MLALAVCVATAALLAAPGLAGAAPSPTGLTVKAQRYTITWGTNTILTGTLMDLDTITALGGLWVRVEFSPTGAPASWTLLSNVTTETDAQYSTGQYTQVVQPRKLTYYRYVFLGTAAYAPEVSNTVIVKVRPFVGRPIVPKTVKAGKYFTVRGSLKPRFPAGAKTVKVKAYRKKGGTWVVAKRLRATNVDTATYSKYQARTSFTKKGKYRFRAFTLLMDGWAPGTSRFSGVLVVK
jgi:hypothetical protein